MDDVGLRRLEELQRQVAQNVERAQLSLPLTLDQKEAAKLLLVRPAIIERMIKRGEIIPMRDAEGRQVIPSSEVVRIAGVKIAPPIAPKTTRRISLERRSNKSKRH